MQGNWSWGKQRKNIVQIYLEGELHRAIRARNVLSVDKEEIRCHLLY